MRPDVAARLSRRFIRSKKHRPITYPSAGSGQASVLTRFSTTGW